MANPNLPLSERFWAKVAVVEVGCWEWLGGRQRPGSYGRLCHQNHLVLAHRVSYELNVGPIPDGLTIDHLCGNKGCVRPDHLEPVERGENARRYTATITECPAGHAYDEANTYVSRNGKRSCRACHRERYRRRRRDAA